MHESLESEMQITGDRAEYGEYAKRILAHKTAFTSQDLR